MAKAKKNGSTKKLRPSEQVRDELKKFMLSINKELQTIKLAGDQHENEINYIGELLQQVETCFEDLENRLDAAEGENEELIATNKEIEEKLTELEAIVNLTHEVNTMVGEIKYCTNNLIDGELMDLFTECLVEIQPAVMLENLKLIKEHKTVI